MSHSMLARRGLMPLAAMAVVTKLPEDRLRKLSKELPALEFGAEPFASLGGVRAVWPANADLGELLEKALRHPVQEDDRAQLGKQRGGRKLALDVLSRVLSESRT